MSGNDRFDAEAEAWDLQPVVVETSRKTFELLKKKDVLNNSYDVLEIGCGTGLLSVAVASHVKRILGVDTAQGMIKKFNSKAAEHSNMTGLVLMLEHAPQISEHTKGEFDKFDLVISHLVFHHIPEMAPTVQVAFDCLKEGGKLVITDFESTEKSRAFHPESKMEGVERHGLSKEEMQEHFETAGFIQIKIEQAYVQRKEIESGGEQDFPFLVCTGTKP